MNRTMCRLRHTRWAMTLADAVAVLLAAFLFAWLLSL